MRREPKKLDNATIAHITGMNNRMMQAQIEHYQRLMNDPNKTNRLMDQECKYCFYSSGIAGQAITETNCSLCNKHMLFGNTNTDTLCIDCGKQHELCKHCGGNIDMDEFFKYSTSLE